MLGTEWLIFAQLTAGATALGSGVLSPTPEGRTYTKLLQGPPGLGPAALGQSSPRSSHPSCSPWSVNQVLSRLRAPGEVAGAMHSAHCKGRLPEGASEVCRASSASGGGRCRGTPALLSNSTDLCSPQSLSLTTGCRLPQQGTPPAALPVSAACTSPD